MSGLQWYLTNDSIFSSFNTFFYCFNSKCQLILGQFIPQFINVIAPNNDLLMDELNMN